MAACGMWRAMGGSDVGARAASVRDLRRDVADGSPRVCGSVLGLRVAARQRLYAAVVQMSAVALVLSLGLVRPADESGPRLTRAVMGHAKPRIRWMMGEPV